MKMAPKNWASEIGQSLGAEIKQVSRRFPVVFQVTDTDGKEHVRNLRETCMKKT